MQRILILHARRDCLADEHVLMELLAVPQHIGDQRYADRAAGVARGIEQGRSLVGRAGRKAVVGCGNDRNKDQRQSDAEQHPRARHEPEVEIAIHIGHVVHRKRDQHCSDGNQVFGLDLAGQTADDEHHRRRDEAARRQHEAGPGRGVAEILLHQLRQKLRRRKQDGAGRQHHQKAGAELAGRHHPKVDRRVAAADLPRDHQHERKHTDDCDPNDKGRAEPVVFEPAVENDLERTEEGRDEREADGVEPFPMPPQPQVRRCGLGLAQYQRNQRHRDQADRAVDHKGPAP